MKKLTLKFRKIYSDYDYEDHNLDVLFKLMDIVLEMLKIANQEDVDNIKRLASFVKVLSSDFCLDVMNADIIDEIYANQILPIFVEFDNKYEDKKCTVENTPEDTVRKYKNKFIPAIKNIKDKFVTAIKRKVDQPKYKSSSYSDDEEFFKYENKNRRKNDKQDEVLFNILKCTGERLAKIYENIRKGSESDLRELYEIKSSTEISEVHENESIKKISSAICVISNFLIGVINDNDLGLLCKREKDIKDSFIYINNLRFN